MRPQAIDRLDHAEAAELFSPFADGELAPADERRLESHLRSCDRCRADWERFVRALALVRGAERVRPSPGFTRGVAGRVRSRRRREAGRATTALLVALPIEAAIPLLLAVGIAALLILLAP